MRPLYTATERFDASRGTSWNDGRPSCHLWHNPRAWPPRLTRQQLDSANNDPVCMV